MAFFSRGVKGETRMTSDCTEGYALYLDAKEARLMAGGADERLEKAMMREAAAKMQVAFLHVLKTAEPIPDEMRVELAIAFEHLCAGKPVDLFTVVPAPGRKELPIAEMLRKDARRYIAWVKGGRIPDPNPFRSIAQAYGVTERTAHRWYESWSDDERLEVRLQFKDIYHKNDPDYVSPEVEQKRDAAFVEKQMKISGRQYQKFVPKGESPY